MSAHINLSKNKIKHKQDQHWFRKFPKETKPSAALLWNRKLAVTYKWKLCNVVKCGEKK